MKAYFYNFTKRANSTKQPASNTGAEYEVTLLEGCSIIAPVIKLDLGLITPPTANYMYLPEFNRYYWLAGDGWTFANRCWYGNFAVDPLASWKSYIGSTTSYVVRAASQWDGTIIDNLYPGKAEVTYEVVRDSQYTSPFVTDGSGWYILGIQGDNAGPNGGAVTYYAMKATAMQQIVNFLLDDANYSSVTDISADLLKCIFNPLQYIVSCMYFPMNITVTGATSSLKVGWWTVTLSGQTVYKLTAEALEYTSGNQYVDIPSHPQMNGRGAYLNASPFSEYYFNAGPFGITPIDNAYKLDGHSVGYYIKVDLITGTGRLEIAPGNTYAVTSIKTAQIGVPIALGQNVMNQGAITDLIGTVASVPNPLALGRSISNAVGDYLQTKFPQVSTTSGNGTLSFYNDFCLLAKFTTVVDDDIVDRGRPLCQAKQISTLSGYIECAEADPAIPCSKSELESIVSYMNGGFFYE